MGLLAQAGTCSGIWLLTAVSRASSCEAGQPQGGTLERSELVGATSGPLDLWTSGRLEQGTVGRAGPGRRRRRKSLPHLAALAHLPGTVPFTPSLDLDSFLLA